MITTSTLAHAKGLLFIRTILAFAKHRNTESGTCLRTPTHGTLGFCCVLYACAVFDVAQARATATFRSPKWLWRQSRGCRFSKCVRGIGSGHVKFGKDGSGHVRFQLFNVNSVCITGLLLSGLRFGLGGYRVALTITSVLSGTTLVWLQNVYNDLDFGWYDSKMLALHWLYHGTTVVQLLNAYNHCGLE